MGDSIMATTINADTSEGLKLTSDTSGELELQANGVTKAKVTSSGLTDSSGNAYGLSKTNGMYRNLLINGDMRIAQRGTSTTGLQYNNDNNFPCCDRWQFSEFGSTSYTAAFTGSQDTDVPSGQGFANSFKFACTTADTTLESDTAVIIRQKIEAQNLLHLKYGTSSAETLTASFWVKSNLTGTFTVVLQHGESGDYYGVDYTIDTADTWEKKTLSFDGNTTDSINNDNGKGLEFRFHLAVGSDYASGTNGQWVDNATVAGIAPNMTNNIGGSTSNYWQVTGVQLEVGEGASDFEFLPYDVQLARCQRYYEPTNNREVLLARILQTNTRVRSQWHWKTPKRAAPTLSIDYVGAGLITCYYGDSGSRNVSHSQTTLNTATINGCFIDITISETMISNIGATLHVRGDLSGETRLIADAEL